MKWLNSLELIKEFDWDLKKLIDYNFKEAKDFKLSLFLQAETEREAKIDLKSY